tara:strand:- start:19716 stop:21185 length:1470 start_codon:yes stop_codon:yes gene_type:complete
MQIANRPLSLQNTNAKKVERGNWGTVQQRARKGLHYYTDLYSGNTGLYGGEGARTNRVLSNSQLWEIYRRCSDVRASVDSIVRRVATYDWVIEPKRSPQEEGYRELAEHCKRATSFLAMPNKNGDTWQEIMTQFLTDVLVFDRGSIEIVYDRNKEIAELVALRGSTIGPVVNNKGRILHYEQNIFSDGEYSGSMGGGEGSTIKFRLDQMLYFNLFPNTADLVGNPLLESLVNETIALMRGSQHAMLALDADEIPPGILVLAGISGRAAEEAKADMQRLKGQDHKIRVMTTPDPTGIGAKWLELKRTPKDIEMRDLIDDLRRAVYRVFGVMPVEMGLTDGMPRSTANAQLDVSSSHLVTPMLELISSKINTRILSLILGHEVASQVRFRFDGDSRLSPEDSAKLATKHQVYVRNGIMTRNEIREELGLLPIVGGDVATMEVAGMPTPVQNLGQAQSLEDSFLTDVDDVGGDTIVPIEPGKPSDYEDNPID